MSTISTENYLKKIFNHNKAFGEKINAVKLAQELAVSNAAISDMAKKLSKYGLISYEKYKGIELTDKGEQMALNVIRRHRLWELFLIKVLDMPWSEVHEQAEVLEHHTSEKLIDRIDEFLGFPDFDPHGHPIPRKNGSLPDAQNYITLAEAVEGSSYELMQVDDHEKKLISYLTKVGFALNTRFVVIDRLDFDKSFTIKFNDTVLSVSQKISESLYLKEIIGAGEKND
ncbi:MAG: metal-dependent transcriptional regulator [Ignavibacteria bacterium]|nr:metal-dependent transcriptional regulator [Ignavibacteria bacterium]